MKYITKQYWKIIIWVLFIGCLLFFAPQKCQAQVVFTPLLSNVEYDTVWVVVGDTTIYYLREHNNIVIPEYIEPVQGAAELYLKKIAEEAFVKEKNRKELMSYIMGLLTGSIVTKVYYDSKK